MAGIRSKEDTNLHLPRRMKDAERVESSTQRNVIAGAKMAVDAKEREMIVILQHPSRALIEVYSELS